MQEQDRKPAVILLGHGSRVPDAGRHMEKVAGILKEQWGHEIVEVCYMSRLGPRFSEAFQSCIRQGAKWVIVIPYFLHEGLHLVLDIPEMMREVARDHPGVRLVLGKNLGFDQLLVDLVKKRILESWHLPDVRDIQVPPREAYPVPPGQCEFFPMTPAQARKYRTRKQGSK